MDVQSQKSSNVTFLSSSSRLTPGGRGVEVRCHGFGPHPALRVHGRVHHRDTCRLCWETHRAQHAVGARPMKEYVGYQNRRQTCRGMRKVSICGPVKVVFALFLPLSLNRHRQTHIEGIFKCCKVLSLSCHLQMCQFVFTMTEETAG